MSSVMQSLWLDRIARTPGYQRPQVVSDDVEPGRSFDIVVVGAGLTGLTTALLFARAGLTVAVVEARQVGAATTGNTTAKLSLLQGTRFTSLLRHQSLRVAHAYVDANREGMEWLLRYCDDHGVPTQRRDAYSYAATPQGRRMIAREARAGRRLGLDVEMTDADELPYPTFGAVRLANQAQVNPMDVLAELAHDVRRHGGVIYEDTRLVGVRASDSVRVTTDRGVLIAGRVVLATGIPVLDRGLYFAKLVPQRSYAMAFRVPGAVPQGMYLSVDSPTRSLRTAPIDGDDRLLIGGNGHIVGRAASPKSLLTDLQRWTEQEFPGAEPTHAWSAQDYEPGGRVPYVGWLPRGRGRVFLATGFDKWGMCNAVAAALTLSADVLGGHLPWARTLHHRITSPADIGAYLGANASVVRHLVGGYVKAFRTGAPASLADGEGTVTHDGIRPVGVCRVGDDSMRVSTVCPHLGGVLAWNDAELSWDCPLHGSRFTADGTRLEGPALRDLKRLP